MPGVTITTGAVAGPSAPTIAPASTYFAVGLAERGAVDEPVLCNSFTEFEANFGTRQSYGALWDDIKMFFEEGGTRAYCARVVGGAATTGALASPLMDQATTPVATLAVAARNPGAWSSRISVQVLAGTAEDTFMLRVFLDGKQVRNYTNLHTPAEAVSRTASDPYIKVTNSGSATVAPDNNPVAQGSPVTLTAGADDRAAVVAATYVAALDRFETGLGDGAVAVPGIGASVHAGLIAHADACNRIALLCEARAADSATLTDTAAALDAKRAGLFAPWVRVPDAFGGTRTISPEGYVAACRARAHAVGPWKAAPAESRARYVLAPDVTYSAATGDELDAAKVNVIRTVAGFVRLYGWKSLSADEVNWQFLTGADVVNRVVTEAYAQLEGYVFGVIDARGHLLAKIEGTLIGIVQPMAAADGLFARFAADGETLLDPGYRVNVSSDLNTTESLALNQVLAELGIRVSPTAALVMLTVTKAAVTAAL
jgi:Bacteriophage tail sheath protein